MHKSVKEVLPALHDSLNRHRAGDQDLSKSSLYSNPEEQIVPMKILASALLYVMTSKDLHHVWICCKIDNEFVADLELGSTCRSSTALAWCSFTI